MSYTDTISNTLSSYTSAPTAEIDQAISWLGNVKQDCDYKITALKRLKADRERSKQWRNEINAIAQEFCDPDALHLDTNTRADIIRQRLGCDPEKALNIAKQVSRWSEREKKKRRDTAIYTLHLKGRSPVEIATRYHITRQQVYNIIRQQKPKIVK